MLAAGDPHTANDVKRLKKNKKINIINYWQQQKQWLPKLQMEGDFELWLFRRLADFKGH